MERFCLFSCGQLCEGEEEEEDEVGIVVVGQL